VDPDKGELLAFLQCFPNLQNLAISWSRLHDSQQPGCSLKRTREPITELHHLHRLQILLHQDFSNLQLRDPLEDPFEKYLPELSSLLGHLPLDHLKHFGVYFSVFLDSGSTPRNLPALLTAISEMRFRELESFHLGFNFDVYSLPILDIWVSTLRKSFFP
jgi:hypothetical protein